MIHDAPAQLLSSQNGDYGEARDETAPFSSAYHKDSNKLECGEGR
jgi:hypothetical protein